jgi:hypothetical protein
MARRARWFLHNPGEASNVSEQETELEQTVDLASFDDLREEFDETLTRLRRLKWHGGKIAASATVVVNVLATALFPTLIAIELERMPSDAQIASEWRFWMLVAVQLVLFILSLFGVGNMGRLMAGLDRVEGLSELFGNCCAGIDDLCLWADGTQELVKTSIQQANATSSSLTILRAICATSPRDDDVEKLLTPMVKDRCDVLGFSGGDDLYNIAIYIWNEEDQVLKLFYRACDDRITRQNRDWKLGLGHVGLCYAKGNLVITPDVSKVPQLMFGTDVERDLAYYRSIAAFPIHGKCKEGIPTTENPIGVLVVTSSKEGHFRLYDQYELFCLKYADILALYFEYLEIYVQHHPASKQQTEALGQ